jgi:hypothetical protein
MPLLVLAATSSERGSRSDEEAAAQQLPAVPAGCWSLAGLLVVVSVVLLCGWLGSLVAVAALAGIWSMGIMYDDTLPAGARHRGTFLSNT